jgi:hypothetical protein
LRRYLLIVLSLAACTPSAPSVGRIEGRADLPPCAREHPRTTDCHITGRDMAIDMMTRPPDRQHQPNAYSEFRQYEAQRERETFNPF